MLGPNGAGKTTLMRAVLGLVRPSQGGVRVLGRPARRGNPAIGYMPQVRAASATLRLSGRDFVAGVVDGHRLGLPLPGRAGRRRSTGRSTWSAPATWRGDRLPRRPAGSASACCWRRR